MRSSTLIQRSLAVSIVTLAALAACSSNSGGGTLTLVSTVPGTGATNVPVESNISATFNHVLRNSTTTTATFYLTPAVDGAVTISGAVATFTHASPLQPNTMYTATLASSVADTNGDKLGADQSWSFTTEGIPDNTAPAQVTNLAAGSPTASTVALSWTAVGNDGEVGTATVYKLRYATGSGCPMNANNFATATAITTGAPKPSGSAESATATGLAPSTAYCFGLIVGDDAGNLSPLSNIANATTTATPDTTPPAAITDLGATATSQSAIQLAWTAPGDNGNTGTAHAYDLRSASGADCPITDATFTAATSVATSAPQVAGSDESADATGLTAATDYCFAIKTSDAAGNVSAISNIADATTDDAPLGTISDLAVSSVAGETVTLGWTTPTHNHASATYDLYYAAGACPGDSSGFIAGATDVSGIAVEPSGPEAYTQSGLLPSTLYCFGVTLTDNGVTSALSNLTSGTTGDNIPPGTVSAINVGTLTVSSVQLSWTAPGDNGATGTVASYDLRYQTAATDCTSFDYATATKFALTGPFAAGGTSESRTVTGLSASTGYCFAFTATDAASNTSGVSVAVFATTMAPGNTSPPAAVTDLAQSASADTGVTLSWTAPGLHATVGTVASYDLRYAVAADCSSFDYSSATPAPFSDALVAAGQTQTATITGLSTITSYCFALTASDGTGDVSAQSNDAVAATTDDVAPAVMTLALSTGTITDHGVTLTSTSPNPNDVAANASAASYDLRYVSPGPSGDCTTAGNFSAGTAVTTGTPGAQGAAETFTVSGLPADATLCFAIASTDAAGNESAYSTAVEVDTLADTTPPAAVTDLAAAFNNDTGMATLTFHMTGDDGQTGQAAKVDAYVVTGASCPITSATTLGAAAAEDTAPAASGALETMSVSASGDVFCFAVIVTDAAGNASAISNSPVHVNNGPTAPSALAATNVTSTGATIGWTAGSGDGTSITTATSYTAGYTAAADCSTFTFTSATPITAPTPTASGTQQGVALTGLIASTSYCFGIEGRDAYGTTSPIATLAFTEAADTTTPQIAAVRAAMATAGTSPITMNLEIDNAVVSYVKTATGSSPDGNGFFLQNSASGPAIYVALDPVTFLSTLTSPPTMAAGDLVSLTVTQGKWTDCSSPCSASNSLYAITTATALGISSGGTVPSALPLASTDVTIPASTANWQYEEMLAAGTVTVASGGSGDGFLSAGTGYEEALSTTGGDSTLADIAVRAPNTLIASSGLTAGCMVQLNGTPIWRDSSSSTGDRTELSVWQQADFSITSCPAPNLTASTPANGDTASQLTPTPSLTFDSPIDPTTLVPSGAGTCTGNVQLTTAAAPSTCIAYPTLTANATNTIFTGGSALSLSLSTAYVLTLTGVKSTNGNSLATTTISFTTAAVQEDCTHMVISQIYGGSGSTGTYKSDFIEIFNRGATTADLTNCSVQYASATGTSWQVTVIAATNSGATLQVPPGGYFLIQETTGTAGTNALPLADDSGGSINLSGTAGKVALVNSTTALTTAASTGSTIVDFVGYGTTATTYEGSNGPAPAPSVTSSVTRNGGGCTDNNDNKNDFSANPFSTGIAPRNSATALNVCSP